jgi:hypothetical protein
MPVPSDWLAYAEACVVIETLCEVESETAIVYRHRPKSRSVISSVPKHNRSSLEEGTQVRCSMYVL